MTTYKLVMPQHMNQYGSLFGGKMLLWVDESAWMAVSTLYPGCNFVTIGMDKVEFKCSVSCGAILKFTVEPHRLGHTSITLGVEVTHRQETPAGVHDHAIFSTEITFVRVSPTGKKMPIERALAATPHI